mmetsp:Transcript_72425/g.212232  ORF Transcript_72425/g.212232 Transcript_72425/m.212232 type:complete len:218 (-) Transcript_72425:15-668(-)
MQCEASSQASARKRQGVPMGATLFTSEDVARGFSMVTQPVSLFWFLMSSTEGRMSWVTKPVVWRTASGMDAAEGAEVSNGASSMPASRTVWAATRAAWSRKPRLFCDGLGASSCARSCCSIGRSLGAGTSSSPRPAAAMALATTSSPEERPCHRPSSPELLFIGEPWTWGEALGRPASSSARNAGTTEVMKEAMLPGRFGIPMEGMRKGRSQREPGS